MGEIVELIKARSNVLRPSGNDLEASMNANILTRPERN
jgi:hypothetical protein